MGARVGTLSAALAEALAGVVAGVAAVESLREPGVLLAEKNAPRRAHVRAVR